MMLNADFNIPAIRSPSILGISLNLANCPTAQVFQFAWPQPSRCWIGSLPLDAQKSRNSVINFKSADWIVILYHSIKEWEKLTRIKTKVKPFQARIKTK